MKKNYFPEGFIYINLIYNPIHATIWTKSIPIIYRSKASFHSYFIMPIAEFILPPFTLVLRKRHSAPIRLPLPIASEVSQTEAPACTTDTPFPSWATSSHTHNETDACTAPTRSSILPPQSCSNTLHISPPLHNALPSLLFFQTTLSLLPATLYSHYLSFIPTLTTPHTSSYPGLYCARILHGIASITVARWNTGLMFRKCAGHFHVFARFTVSAIVACCSSTQ